MAATRRLRPEDWAPAPQTRIQIRSAPTREPREERAKFAKGGHQKKPSRPAPIIYAPGESPIASGLARADNDSPRAPEIVDFAAPGTWPRRAPPHHIAYQQQQWGPKRVASPGAISQCPSQRSEMSFGILDYYTRDPSPSRNSTLPPTPKLPEDARGAPKVATPVIDPAMDKFDFGLPLRPGRPASQTDPSQVARPRAADATAGAEIQAPSTPQSSAPIPPPKIDRNETSRNMYTLFPKDTPPPSRTITAANTPTQEGPPTSTVTALPLHPQPVDPSYRPRKESLTSSLGSGSAGSRKDSFTGHRATRIPLRILSSSGSSIYTTPRATHTNANSPPSSSSTCAASRWSDETISSPVAAVHSGSSRRASFGSLLRGVEEERKGEVYPACFFEDDDDEVVPLRRKLQWGRVSGQQSRIVEGEGRGKGKKKKERGWTRWVLCGCGG